MNEVGRPTDLTDELVKNIKRHILDGKNLKETANACGIDEQKLYNWNCDNYLNISDKIEGWRRDRKLNLAERNIEEILTIGLSDKDLVKTVADMSKFVSETLGRNNYSKRTETDLTTKGKEIAGFNYVIPNDNDNSDNQTPSETAQSMGETSGQDN